MILALMFVGLLLLIVLNVPIAIALGLVGAVAVYSSYGVYALPNIGLTMFEGATSFTSDLSRWKAFAGGTRRGES